MRLEKSRRCVWSRASLDRLVRSIVLLGSDVERAVKPGIRATAILPSTTAGP